MAEALVLEFAGLGAGEYAAVNALLGLDARPVPATGPQVCSFTSEALRTTG